MSQQVLGLGHQEIHKMTCSTCSNKGYLVTFVKTPYSSVNEGKVVETLLPLMNPCPECVARNREKRLETSWMRPMGQSQDTGQRYDQSGSQDFGIENQT